MTATIAKPGSRPTFKPIQLKERTLFFGKRCYIMGVVNRTPDSFSDGGKFSEEQTALEHALHMIEAGADIIDIGGESTRPGSAPVSLHEELWRVIPLIEALRGRSAVAI